MPLWLKEWFPLVALGITLTIGLIGWLLRSLMRPALISRDDLDQRLAAESASRTAALATVENRLAADFVALRKDHAAFGDRLQKIEVDMQHLPTAKAVAELKDMLGEVRSDMREITATVNAQQREHASVALAMNRIEDILMQRPK